MRKFKYAFTVGGGPREPSRWFRTLRDAAHLDLSDSEVDALADLQVGQTYVDCDGDTWERVE